MHGATDADALVSDSPQVAQTPLSVHRLFHRGAVLQRGVELPIWGEAAEGRTVSVSIQGHTVQTRADGGRWRLTLPPLREGGPFTLTVSTPGQVIEFEDVLVGEVWLCAGQSNMGFPLRQSVGGPEAVAGSRDERLRFFNVPFVAADEPQPLTDGVWVAASPESAGGFSAVGYHFGRELRQHLDVPVGVVVAQLGGTQIQAWMSGPLLRERFPWLLRSWQSTKLSLARHHAGQPTPPDVQRHTGSFTQLSELELRYFKGTGRLFNGMIAPLAPFAFRGSVWYQGESDQGQAHQYRIWLAALIEDWRRHFEQENLPFLVVMLPGYGRPDQGFTMELRDAQLRVARTTPGTHLAIAVDLGDERNVHPPNKRPVAERLARLARAAVYDEPITPTGPIFRDVTFESGRALIAFDHVGGGLEVHGETLSGFTLAGSDEVFHPATAWIEGDRVVVEAPAVPDPVAVRYAWTNTPRLTLWNAQGLPAAPFRSDDFTLRTHWNARRD